MYLPIRRPSRPFLCITVPFSFTILSCCVRPSVAPSLTADSSHSILLEQVAKKKATFSPAGVSLRESLAHQRRFATAHLAEVR